MLYAKRIAQGKGIIIPDEAKANSAAMSAWIDSNQGTKRRKRGRKRAAIMWMKFSVHTGA
jgi:DNA topoisomerase III